MKIYISGPITGLTYEQAWLNFKTAEEHLIEEGYDVVNPFNNGLDPDDPWEAHMKADIKLLMGCDAIYILSNWKESEGARIEIALAIALGYHIMKQETSHLIRRKEAL